MGRGRTTRLSERASRRSPPCVKRPTRWRCAVAFSLDQYAALRPTLWHLTHRDNLPLIRSSRRLLPAADLVPEDVGAVRQVRRMMAGQPVLREQDLLHEGCVEFSDGWAMTDFLSDLASRVFFWSGWRDRPVRPGRHATERYSKTDLVIRVPFRDLVRGHTPDFSRCNSGATRMQGGRRVQRGPGTFRQAAVCDFGVADVVEVTFRGPVAVPPTAEVAVSMSGPWEPF